MVQEAADRQLALALGVLLLEIVLLRAEKPMAGKAASGLFDLRIVGDGVHFYGVRELIIRQIWVVVCCEGGLLGQVKDGDLEAGQHGQVPFIGVLDDGLRAVEQVGAETHEVV